jgi:hypothetical protein
MISELDMLKWLRSNHTGEGYASEEPWSDEDQIENDAWDNRYDPVPGWDVWGECEWPELSEDERYEVWLEYLREEEGPPRRFRSYDDNQNILTGSYDLNSWALVNEDYEYIRLAQACVAGLNSINYDFGGETWLRWHNYDVFYLTGDGSTPKDYQHTMMEYVIKRSPYRHAYLITDVDQAMKYGNSYDCTQWTSNYIVGAATAHRIAGELPHMAKAFSLLRQVFSNEHLAFLACQAVDVVKGTFSVAPYYGSNHSIHSTYSCGSPDSWLRFIADDHSEVNKGKRMAEDTSYCHIMRAWGSDTGDTRFKIKEVNKEPVTFTDSFDMPYTDHLGVSGQELEAMIWETLR